ncbi:hypothetical protein QJV43_gp59 [Serratia phage Serbin]|uniref:Uncharacterized protein n=2 Tax=Serbinvirus TaxID=3153074 RepID=A0A482MH42_9CAUD|nr:hypothetical protein QJV43_gp59 [Serratia phage Serbin]QBQ72975.1 hypothetical protein CPT_Serbin_059 [Serratia phage Serbin]
MAQQLHVLNCMQTADIATDPHSKEIAYKAAMLGMVTCIETVKVLKPMAPAIDTILHYAGMKPDGEKN